MTFCGIFLSLTLTVCPPDQGIDRSRVLNELNDILPYLTKELADHWIDEAGPIACSGVIKALDDYLLARGSGLDSAAEVLMKRAVMLNRSLTRKSRNTCITERLESAQQLDHLQADLMAIARRAFDHLHNSDWRSPQVREAVRQVLSIDPSHPVANAVIAHWYARRARNRNFRDPGDLRRAESALAASRATDIEYFEVVSAKGYLKGTLALWKTEKATRQELWQRAETLHLRAIQLGHCHPHKEWFNVAECRAALDLTEEALEAYARAMQCCSNWNEPYTGIGRLHFERESYEKALVAFHRAMRLSRDAGESAIRALETHIRLNRFDDDALKIAGKIVSSGYEYRSKNPVLTYLILARTLIETGYKNEARMYYQFAAFLSEDPRVKVQYPRYAFPGRITLLEAIYKQLAWEDVLDAIKKSENPEDYSQLRKEAKAEIAVIKKFIRKF